VPHASRFTRGGRSNSRRLTSWSAGPKSSLINVASTAAILWDTGAQALVDGLTIVRTRGILVMTMRLATSVGDGFQNWAAGICVVSENAFNAGVASVPAPLTDISWDGWLWHHQGGHITSLETTEVHRPTGAIEVVIDSKAMRKIKNTDVQIGVLQMGTEIGTATVDFSARTRVLDKQK